VRAGGTGRLTAPSAAGGASALLRIARSFSTSAVLYRQSLGDERCDRSVSEHPNKDAPAISGTIRPLRRKCFAASGRQIKRADGAPPRL
jgi:hypothetical protein